MGEGRSCWNKSWTSQFHTKGTSCHPVLQKPNWLPVGSALPRSAASLLPSHTAQPSPGSPGWGSLPTPHSQPPKCFPKPPTGAQCYWESRIPSVYCHIKSPAGMEDEQWKHILGNPRTPRAGSHCLLHRDPSQLQNCLGAPRALQGGLTPSSSLSWVLDQHRLSFPDHPPPVEQLLIPISLPVLCSASSPSCVLGSGEGWIPALPGCRRARAPRSWLL